MNTFRNVLAIHRWDTPVVVPVDAKSSLEDPRAVFMAHAMLLLVSSVDEEFQAPLEALLFRDSSCLFFQTCIPGSL